MKRFLHLLYGLLLSFCITTTGYGQVFDTKTFQAMKVRSVGPAGMSGRVTSIAGVPDQPHLFFIGTASGGVWKSNDGGENWKPIFDEQPVLSIGVVAVQENNPAVIWVGTGEGNPRNSQSSGNGIYKSVDGGKTWQHMGLDKTRNIHRIIINKTNPNIVIVGAQGSAWGPTTERGVYKTTDGGKTWKQILYKNKLTGVADLIVDPHNPNKILAAMWEFRRFPWFFQSGGEGSGLYISYDGGDTWRELTEKNGLPTGQLGRMGLALAYSKPNIVYAYIEGEKKNGIYKSIDGGENWAFVNDKNVGTRPFYYADIYVDPENENRVFSLFTRINYSEDGGKNFSVFVHGSSTSKTRPGLHSDNHALWINPKHPNIMLAGNDGGLGISRNKGETWHFVEGLPLGQFYHINVDMDIPYNIMGGLQDNGSWRGPSSVWVKGGLRNMFWENLMGGDGFDVVPDLKNPDYIYAMSQGGNIARQHLTTKETVSIVPETTGDTTLRFNWNAAISVDPIDQQTLYFGSQFVHKSRDYGKTWEVISPDLTTNNPEKQKANMSGGLTYDATFAENYTTILAIAPSPLKQGVIWVGTDDGKVHITKDSGESWEDLTANLIKKSAIPPQGWVNQIVPSPHDEATAFVVINNYRQNDWTPYLLKTTDFGKTWSSIVNKEQVWSYALSFVQDPIEPNLMFLGTETGLYVSIDGGDNWNKWNNGYPNVSTYDMTIHPRDHDLVLGTFGRAIYVLDDIRPLRALANKGTALLQEPLYLFDIPDAYQVKYQGARGTRSYITTLFTSENKPHGAMISFYVHPDNIETKNTKATIHIYNQEGQKVRTTSTKIKGGINRYYWDYRLKGEYMPSYTLSSKKKVEPSGFTAYPGEYAFEIEIDETKVRKNFILHPDPRFQGVIEKTQREELKTTFYEIARTATKMTDQLLTIRNNIDLTHEAIKRKSILTDSDKALQKELNTLKNDLVKVLQKILPTQNVKGIIKEPHLLSFKLNKARGALSSSIYMNVSETATKRVASAQQTAIDIKHDINGILKRWNALEAQVKNTKLPLIQEVK